MISIPWISVSRTVTRAKRHERALAKGETCIDCHDGIAHELPERPDEKDDG